MKASLITDTSQLRGKFVYLQVLQHQHVPVLRRLARNESLWEYTKTLLINEHYDEQFDKYIEVAFDDQGEGLYTVGLQQTFTIFRTGDDAIIGMTRFYGIDEKQKRLDIGYTWYIPEVWGKAHNKECKLLLLQFAFEVWQYNRVGFHVAHQNIRSQKALEKIGASKEGFVRNHSYRNDGSVRHTVLYSIINEEWQQVKLAIQHLLSQYQE
ncbi:MAG: GNAT family protein [Chitinophagaceae bacterium]